MEKQITLAIIKPDAVAAKNTGKIIDLIEHNGFEILGLGKIQLTKEHAETFYAVHAERGFFPELVEFMTSGPVVVLALEKENAVAEWRKLMGETDPAKAAAGTVRKLYGKSIGENATHGSDSEENAEAEIEFFFPYMDEEDDIELELE
ncbi:MAG: nucleoside-diphosphate kinase [Candidatus Babeliales bacterium]|nr:nucleoside-diphosphate kinase [Candidatus Babeliales bacterium]